MSTATEEIKDSLSSVKINKLYNSYVKRILDLVLATVLIVLLSPLIIIIAILIKLDSPGPVIYKGLRGGYKNSSFYIYKFRSMVVNAEQIGGGTTALNDARITSIGGILRKTKLDEIPQLFNILKGEMSFIGPRPELLKYTSRYSGEEKYILQVRPGITDISSIKFIKLDELVGDSDADEKYELFILEEKNNLRIEYVIRQSLLLDIKLFLFTVWSVIIKAVGVIIGSLGGKQSGI